ncbi:Glutamate formimidoyltransferase [Porphyridium purpureum]|uniref:Glutamate formimidoyltransferase n=1 Tax=Porphyridium purpureum TaxID=35688 RepID=A0A5J4YZG6_PORPP|nr:Glutamate formimidoyltransferase [Porphyridium purpureum]|eukprot:POR8535..scf208_2
MTCRRAHGGSGQPSQIDMAFVRACLPRGVTRVAQRSVCSVTEDRPILLACLLNLSEARNVSKVEEVAAAAGCAGAAIVHVFRDHDYNRSVITLVGKKESLLGAVKGACSKAIELLDLREHIGHHARAGVVDLIPFHPLTEDDEELRDCAELAQKTARFLEDRGMHAFLYGAADPQGRSLVYRRKMLHWFQNGAPLSNAEHIRDLKLAGEWAEYGPPIGSTDCVSWQKLGIAGVGATPYVINFNVTLESADMKLGRAIAAQIRATAASGLEGVESMAFPHDGRVEIACNLRSTAPPPEVVFRRIEHEASMRGLQVVGEATIVGYSRKILLEKAHALITET